MRNWMDLNGDGEIDSSEMMFAGEMLCTSREEHEALFGDAGDFESSNFLLTSNHHQPPSSMAT